MDEPYKIAVMADVHLAFADVGTGLTSRLPKKLRTSKTKDAEDFYNLLNRLVDEGYTVVLNGDIFDPVSAEGINAIEHYLETGETKVDKEKIEHAVEVYTNILDLIKESDNVVYVLGNHEDPEILRKHGVDYVRSYRPKDWEIEFEHGDKYEIPLQYLGFGPGGRSNKFFSNYKKIDKKHVAIRDVGRFAIGLVLVPYDAMIRTTYTLLHGVYFRDLKDSNVLKVFGHYHPVEPKHNHDYLVVPAYVKTNAFYLIEKNDDKQYTIIEIKNEPEKLKIVDIGSDNYSGFEGYVKVWEMSLDERNKIQEFKRLK